MQLGVAAILRLLAYLAVGHWLTYLLFFQPYELATLRTTAAAFAALFVLLLAAARWLPVDVRRRIPQRLPRRLIRAGDLVAFNLCLLLVGGELAARLVARVTPSVLLSRPDERAERRIAAMRSAPGRIRFGFPVDRRGFYDTEPSGDRRLIVVLGDSFSQGVVPHHYHYTTVAERVLAEPSEGEPTTEIYNAGIAGIDPPEYLHLLGTEVLPLDPDLVVVAVFLGNDLTFKLPPPQPFLARWYDARNVLWLQVPKRLWALRRAPVDGTPGTVLSTTPESDLVEQTPEALAAAFPWVEDPLLERPTFRLRAVYEQLKLKTARDLATQTDAGYRRRFEVLGRIADLCGDVPVLFLLIPDELHVDDELWRTIQQLSGRPLSRRRAHGLLLHWLDARGLEYADALPALRAQDPLADGRPHLYHLQDTHLNARGNRVLGEVLAAAIEPKKPGR